jgi:hypothetical protein
MTSDGSGGSQDVQKQERYGEVVGLRRQVQRRPTPLFRSAVTSQKYSDRVRISSQDLALVELDVTGYQFPDAPGRGERDRDANWLRVRGAMTQADEKSWSFDDPCLTTWRPGN